MILDWNDFEVRRCTLQTLLDAEKSPAERNRLGQFATPNVLAREILAYSLTLLPPCEPIRFLDPAFGTGSFYSALQATAANRIVEATGYEIDNHYGRAAAELWAKMPLNLAAGDFTMAQPPQDKDKPNLLVCNPPYVRHQHMSKDEKSRLQNASKVASGIRITGLAGLYAYFLALSHAWMAEDGIAAWLIPSEFMDVNYGKAIKQYLLSQVTLLRIHRFAPTDMQFSDALVSSAVVWFRRQQPPQNHNVEFSFGGSLTVPAIRKKILITDLSVEAKWTHYPKSSIREINTGFRLKDFFKIQRGIATGDNKFFIMTADDAIARGIPKQFLRPVLPSPRYVSEDEVMANEEGIPVIDRQLFLLDCRLPESEVRAKYRDLWAYLQSGIPEVSRRYLCAHRLPWYSQENRPASPFVCTYMGRSKGRDNISPFRFILNHSQAIVTNVYLLLYPKPELKAALEHDPGLARSVWDALRCISPKDLIDEGRVYGGGLYKMEPKELANVRADTIAKMLYCQRRGSTDLLQSSNT